MHIAEIYFAFHRRATVQDVRSGTPLTSIFGHVEAFGYTIDETWFFFDPRCRRTVLTITHIHDEVEQLLTEKFAAAQHIIRYSGESLAFRAPIHGPMNCVTQCAGLIGIRAFTPWGFRRKLLAHKAEVVHHEIGTKGRSGGQEGADAGAPAIPS